MKVLSIVGNRPQFVKEAVVYRALKDSPLQEVLVHSGQHYDALMSDVFFQTLGIREPDYNLSVGSGTHGYITGNTMMKLEEVVRKEKPALILVYGDTDTTLAGALVAAKEKIPLAHIEAGIRMQPHTMPEEINRVVTDRISDLLFAPSQQAFLALQSERPRGRISFVGDVMYDLFLIMRERFTDATFHSLDLREGQFALVTLHREANVDSPEALRKVLTALNDLSKDIRIVFPVHPRTRKRIKEFGLEQLAASLAIIDPVDYLEMMGLLVRSSFVITDSGGLQKEAYFGGKRALVLLQDAGWRELTDCGWNILGTPDTLFEKAQALSLSSRGSSRSIEAPPPMYGAGDAGKRIAALLSDECARC